jgi:hypothetical protein
MDHPVDVQLFPEAARKALAGPPPLRLMVARGMAPLPPAALVCALYALAYDRNDDKLREAAQKTLGALPEAVLNGALNTPDLPAAVLDDLAQRLTSNDAAMERILRHGNVAAETVAQVARRCSESLCDVIATNEQRLLRHPEIIEALYMNEKARMSTADRVVELAARNGLTLKIPGFDAIVEALQAQRPRSASGSAEAAEADQEFKTVMEATAGLGDDVVQEQEDGTLTLKGEAAQKADKSIAKMSVTEKIRTAMLGNAAARAILIRSPNKLVSNAVLQSPKLNDDEVIKYAASRQVSADVLRKIASSKVFTRLYDVKLNLVNNPKTPLTDSMKFLSHLRDSDLRKVLGNKNVPAGLRNAANGMVNAKGKK